MNEKGKKMVVFRRKTANVGISTDPPGPEFVMGADESIEALQKELILLRAQRETVVTAARSMVKVGMAVLNKLGATL